MPPQFLFPRNRATVRIHRAAIIAPTAFKQEVHGGEDGNYPPPPPPAGAGGEEGKEERERRPSPKATSLDEPWPVFSSIFTIQNGFVVSLKFFGIRLAKKRKIERPQTKRKRFFESFFALFIVLNVLSFPSVSRPLGESRTAFRSSSIFSSNLFLSFFNGFDGWIFEAGLRLLDGELAEVFFGWGFVKRGVDFEKFEDDSATNRQGQGSGGIVFFFSR